MMNFIILLLICSCIAMVIIIITARAASKRYAHDFEEFRSTFNELMPNWDLLFQEEAFNLWQELEEPIEDILDRVRNNNPNVDLL